MTILIVAILSSIPFVTWLLCKEYDTTYYIAELTHVSMDDAKEIQKKLENMQVLL